MKNRLLALLLALSFSIGFGQDIPWLDSLNSLPLNEFLEQLETSYGYQVFLLDDSIPSRVVEIPAQKGSLTDILNNNLHESGYSAVEGPSKQLYIIKGPPVKAKIPIRFFQQEAPDLSEQPIGTKKDESEFLATDREYITREVTIGSAKDGWEKELLVLEGIVKGKETQQTIVSGTVFILESGEGTVTDNSGYYRFELKKGVYTLRFSSLESMDISYKVNLLSDGKLDALLPTRYYQLNEVVVSSDHHHNVRGNQMGLERITSKMIKEIPAVMGERDLINIALMLPGVQTVGEGSSGFNVRGSPVDQNMFYLNQVPVYNPSHLFGFFSAFNANAVSEFALLKANIPSNYGGRLASVFDITARKGRKDKFSMRGGISPITGNLIVEGPLQKNKSSYMVSLRSTYSDWILRQMSNPTLNNSSAYFGDAMANFFIQLNPKNELNILGYYSYDDADIADLTKNTYQNRGGSIEWRSVVKEKHSFELSLATAGYNFENENVEYDFAAYSQRFFLNHHEFKASFTLRPNKAHSINVGLNGIAYNTDQGDLLPATETSQIKRQTFEEEQAAESGIFISDHWHINDKLELTAGLRYNWYKFLGPKTVYTYSSGFPKELETVTDTTYYSNLESIATYSGLDYRLGIKYLIDEQLSVKASYNRLHQYIFMLSNTIAVSPTDLWKLADNHIEPMVGDQVSAGIYTNVLGNILEFSVEGYYKRVKNLVEYKDGANLLLSATPETEVIQGELDAWGLEFMLRKTFGDLNGWINYTYSSTEVTAVDPGTGKRNNNGLSYPANYDKPHAFNVVANYKLSRRLSFSGNVVYSTGRPVTYPKSVYYLEGIEVIHYSQRNEFRLPDYFRVDLAMNIEGNLKRNKWWHSSWSLSVYNVTGRKNVYSVFFTTEDGKTKAYQLSIFGVPVFSISYNFKLGNYAN